MERSSRFLSSNGWRAASNWFWTECATGNQDGSSQVMGLVRNSLCSSWFMLKWAGTQPHRGHREACESRGPQTRRRLEFYCWLCSHSSNPSSLHRHFHLSDTETGKSPFQSIHEGNDVTGLFGFFFWGGFYFYCVLISSFHYHYHISSSEKHLRKIQVS